MSGRKKQKKSRSPLPSQYEFVPRTQAPPPAPSRQPPPSVSDYPPPVQLFQDSTVQPRRASTPSPQPRGSQTSPRVSQTSPPVSQTSQHRVSQTSQPRYVQTSLPRGSQTSLPRGSQASATRQPPSPQSQSTSEAQNSESAEGADGSEDEEFTHVELNLSEDQMDVVTALLSQPGRELCTTLSPYLEPGTTWFGRDKGKLSRKISKILKNKFNGPYYSWTVVPRERQERWFVEFAKTHTWRPTLTGIVQENFEKIGLLRLKDMVSTCRTSRKRPTWIKKLLWKQMCEFWDTPEAVEKSLTTSTARMSERKGLGPHTHNSGQKSFQQIEQEMVEELGRPVTLAEVFIKTHTKKDGTFVDKKAWQVAEAYKKNKQAKLDDLEAENADPSDSSSQAPELSIDEDNEIFLLSTFTNNRGRHYGIGSLESTLVNGKRKYSASSSILDLQKQLDEAHRKIEEQAAQNAIALRKIEEQAAQNANALRIIEEQATHHAEQGKKLKELSLADKYLSATDPKYLAFVAANKSDD